MKELAAHKKQVEREAVEIKKSLKSQVREADKATQSKEERQRRRRAKSKNVYDAIGFDLMFEDGICQVEDGIFSQSIDFSDVSYQSADQDDQEAILDQYATVFDGCGPDIELQVTVVNTPVPERQIGRKEFFQETGNAQLDRYVSEYNSVLNRKMMEGVSNIERNRYITYAVKASTYEEALPKLQRVYSGISSALDRMGSVTRRLTGTERLGVISNILRPFHEYSFDYKSLLVSGLTAKDSICPMTLDFAPDGLSDLFKSDDTWGQVLVFREIGAQLEDLAISELVDLPIPMCVSMHVHPLDKNSGRDLVRRKLVWIDKDTTERQEKAVRKGYDYNNLPQELKYAKSDAEELLHELQYENQKLYEFTGIVYTYAKSFEELRGQAVEIVRTAGLQGIELDVLECQQREALNTMLPLASNHIGATRRLTTTQVAMFIPFATSELNQENGGYYGQNQVSHNLILMNRRKLAAPMGWVFGQPGSGKSFGVKREITNTYLTNPKAEFIIIDPKDEYSLLVKALGGTAFNLAMGSPDRINIFDFYDGTIGMVDADPIDYKSETVQAAASVVMGAANTGLTPAEKTVIDRCVRLTYATCPEGRFPKIEDFHAVLLDQPEPEAARLATGFELFVSGAQRYFNSETTVSFDKRITSFSFQKISETMRVFAMILIMDYVYNRMLFNFKRGVQTWLYIDEVQSLFSTPTVIEYFDKFWAEGRSYNMIPTAITQTPERVINHEIAKFLIRNSDFILLYKLAPADRITMSELLNLSPQQQQAIGAGAQPGEGLLIAGASTISFEDEWPEGALYDLWDTKPENLARKNEAEWIMRQRQESDTRLQASSGRVERNLAGKAEQLASIEPASQDFRNASMAEMPTSPDAPEPAIETEADSTGEFIDELLDVMSVEKPKPSKEALKDWWLENPTASYAEMGRNIGVSRSTAAKWAREIEKEMTTKDRVRMFYARNPEATKAEAAKTLGIAASTVRRWLKEIEKEKGETEEVPAKEKKREEDTMERATANAAAQVIDESHDDVSAKGADAPIYEEYRPQGTVAQTQGEAVFQPTTTSEHAGLSEERKSWNAPALEQDSVVTEQVAKPDAEAQPSTAVPAYAIYGKPHDKLVTSVAEEPVGAESASRTPTDEERVMAYFTANASATIADAARELGMNRRTVKKIAHKLKEDNRLQTRRPASGAQQSLDYRADLERQVAQLESDEHTWTAEDAEQRSPVKAMQGGHAQSAYTMPAQKPSVTESQINPMMPALITCPTCGKAINATASFCERCGTSVGANAS